MAGLASKTFEINPEKKGLLIGNPVYKPFRYPWCYDAWLTQQRIHWLPEEVPMSDDVQDWKKKLHHQKKIYLCKFLDFSLKQMWK